jgi:integrase
VVSVNLSGFAGCQGKALKRISPRKRTAPNAGGSLLLCSPCAVKGTSMSSCTGPRERKFPFSVKRGSVEVKIYRTPSHDCDRYTISYYQDGARKRPSFSTFEEAKSEAETVAGRLASTDADVLVLRSADRAAYQRARQLLDPHGVAIETAAVQFTEAKGKLGDVPLIQAVGFYLKRHPKEPRRVQTVVDELIAAKKADGLSERYLQSLRWALPKFVAAFHCNIGDVTAPQIGDWLRASGLSPRTQNNLRNSVQTLFSYAKARRYLPKDYDEIDSVPLAKDRGGEIEIYSPSELEEILACASELLVPFLSLGAFAGVRHAEIQRLEWQDIRFDDDIIEIRAAKAKTASRRTVPILDNLREWLSPAQQSSELVCPYRNVAFEMHMIAKRIKQARRFAWAQGNGVTETELKRTDQLVREQAKPAKRNARQKREVPPGAETAKVEGWQPFAWKHNALRHSFISYRIVQVQNVQQVALEAGNSPQIIFSNYRELVRPADAQKWFSIVPKQTKNILQFPRAAVAIVGQGAVTGASNRPSA